MDINESPKHSHFRIGDLKRAINTKIARHRSTTNETNQRNVSVIITIFLRSAKLHNKNHNQIVLKIKIQNLTLQLNAHKG
mgnify:FL=1